MDLPDRWRELFQYGEYYYFEHESGEIGVEVERKSGGWRLTVDHDSARGAIQSEEESEILDIAHNVMTTVTNIDRDKQ